tara:strand:- start:79 stop:411 length:333 start_codon:yes stop_codon:yes gene_type:complete
MENVIKTHTEYLSAIEEIKTLRAEQEARQKVKEVNTNEMNRIKKVRYNARTMSGLGLVTEIYEITEEEELYFMVNLISSDGDLAMGEYTDLIWKADIGKNNHEFRIEKIK